MAGNEHHESAYESQEAYGEVRKERIRLQRKDERVSPRPGYLIELSGQAIPLDLIEFRILRFLSARPYKAYTRQQIVTAISTSSNPVTVETLDGHIMTLRDKLGLFSDYVQSVPHVGYRFKE
jgi:DNA-binding response OmpR family regulator